MRITYEYLRLFVKMMLSNKIAFVWYLIFPLVAFLIFNYSWFDSRPTTIDFYIQTSFFISYITFVMSIDVATHLITLRENGFYKMFKFISGSKYPFIWGKALNQVLFIIATIFLVSFVTGVMFLDPAQLVTFLITAIVSCILGSIILILLTLVLMLIPIRQESLNAVISMSLLVLFFVSAKGFAYSTEYSFLFVLLNPLEYVRNITFIFADWFTGHSFAHESIGVVGIISACYVICGLIALKLVNVISRTHRT
ncbi:hypothetical protein MH215_19665 [Paenibacillus sp. ACRSA]|uniref:hypothetical protein n=1 Tax=Paenibacillus sp. ACRSA TaxID=2918211 RepID=UPI001EF696DB|nr:hypothetical protein [Paenibacillus sp. ACRSA]MCG7379220.1 hypothetical protein [Paenibacillus sp. ACRSA]